MKKKNLSVFDHPKKKKNQKKKKKKKRVARAQRETIGFFIKRQTKNWNKNENKLKMYDFIKWLPTIKWAKFNVRSPIIDVRRQQRRRPMMMVPVCCRAPQLCNVNVKFIANSFKHIYRIIVHNSESYFGLASIGRCSPRQTCAAHTHTHTQT